MSNAVHQALEVNETSPLLRAGIGATPDAVLAAQLPRRKGAGGARAV